MAAIRRGSEPKSRLAPASQPSNDGSCRQRLMLTAPPTLQAGASDQPLPRSPSSRFRRLTSSSSRAAHRRATTQERMDGMADDVEVDSDLECAVCLSLLCEPVEWPGTCSHSFCRLCLLRLHTLAKFRCPMCRCPCSSPSTAVTLVDISRWPVSHERRCPVKTR